MEWVELPTPKIGLLFKGFVIYRQQLCGCCRGAFVRFTMNIYFQRIRWLVRGHKSATCKGVVM